MRHRLKLKQDLNRRNFSLLVSDEMLLCLQCFSILRCLSAWKEKRKEEGLEKRINLTSGEISFTASLLIIVSVFMWDGVERSGGGGDNYALACSCEPLQSYCTLHMSTPVK